LPGAGLVQRHREVDMALWFERALLADGWRSGVRVTLDGDRIAGVEPDAAPAPDDSRHGPAIPGLANVHSHAFQRAMAGLTEVRSNNSDSFWTWREQMYRFLDRLDPEGVRTIAALAYIEMLESGFTRVGEFHYLHNDANGVSYANPAALAEAIAEAASETGIALTLLPVLYRHANFGGEAPTSGQRRFILSLDQYTRLLDACRGLVKTLPGANFGVAPHSLRAVTPEELAAVVALAADGPIHIHAAEQIAEVEACLAWSGARPVEWLLDHGAGLGWCLIHATHLSDTETQRLAASGAVVGLCPVTEANLGDGIFPAEPYLAANGAFGIGTDSNVAIDAAQELRALEYSQRLLARSRNVLAAGAGESTGATLHRGALAGGARALGVSVPTIAAAEPADIVSLVGGLPAGDRALDSWVFAGRNDHVDSVWRAGKRVVANGRHIHRDLIATRYAALLRTLLQ
jgi:formiminoglutamate deiminase